jgi:sporulation protein YlmC with PRC-barrel domain
MVTGEPMMKSLKELLGKRVFVSENRCSGVGWVEELFLRITTTRTPHGARE